MFLDSNSLLIAIVEQLKLIHFWYMLKQIFMPNSSENLFILNIFLSQSLNIFPEFGK